MGGVDSDRDGAARRSVEALWRRESVSVVATLTREVRDFTLAEDLAQDALIAALETWPRSGVPDRPAAWLLTVARRRMIDRARRSKRFAARQAEIARSLADAQARERELEANDPEDIGDDTLRLLYLACHPALGRDGQAALALRVVAGLTTEAIARLFLVSEATVAQRIVRAKRTLQAAGATFGLPPAAERSARLAGVLEVVYLLFTEGHATSAAASGTRPELCHEARRLGRTIAAVAPTVREAHGLVALMEFQSSRLSSRVDADGHAVLLADQDRRRWDRAAIARGEAALALAWDGAAPGPYGLQAAIAAVHARATSFMATEWDVIVRLYDELAACAPSPAVEINRAVALSYAEGPEAGLVVLDRLGDDPHAARHPLLAAVRGDLLARSGRREEAEATFAAAARAAPSAPVRALAAERLGRLGEQGPA